MSAAMDSSLALINTNPKTTITPTIATPIKVETISSHNNQQSCDRSNNQQNGINHLDHQQQQTNNCKLMGHIEDRLDRYRAKRLRFLINGDKYFAGINYALNTERIRSFDALLNDLTRSLSMDHLKLCKGVRYIFTSTGAIVQALTDFQDGHTYICSSTDVFTVTEYRLSTGVLDWLVRNSACISSSQKERARLHQTPNSKQRNNVEPSHNNSTNQSTRSVNKIHRVNHSTPSRTVNQHRPRQQQRQSEQKLQHPKQQIQRAQSPQKQAPQQQSEQSIQQVGSIGKEVLEKYDIGRPIGDGHFSVVYCCMNKSTQEFCALKLIDKLKGRGKDEMIYNEVKILKRLCHPNIVKLIEEFYYPKQLYLILELVRDGDLFDAISNVTKFSEVDVATMIHNLSSALTYLHAKGIVHRDIKPENLLISVHEDGSQSVKLADFGLAVEVSDSPLFNVCGTAFYVSPEMLNETGYSYKVDVWSTGVICYILLCGYPPFTSENENNQDQLFDAILAGEFEFSVPQWSKISIHAKNLIRCMLIVDPEKRYTAEQVFRHPWTMGISSNFDGINPMNMSRKIACQFHESM